MSDRTSDVLVFGADDPEYNAARELIEQRGVKPGPDGHTSQQLIGALEQRGWSCKLNEDDFYGGPGDFAAATKYYTPSPTVSHSIAIKATSPVVALTIVLAKAIQFDELPDHVKRVP